MITRGLNGSHRKFAEFAMVLVISEQELSLTSVKSSLEVSVESP